MREITIKIGLERLDTQEEITVEALLDSRATGLVMSLEFARKKVSRSLTVDFILFLFFSSYFIFIFLSFLFLFLEQLGLGLIGHAVTSVTS